MQSPVLRLGQSMNFFGLYKCVRWPKHHAPSLLIHLQCIARRFILKCPKIVIHGPEDAARKVLYNVLMRADLQ